MIAISVTESSVETFTSKKVFFYNKNDKSFQLKVNIQKYRS